MEKHAANGRLSLTKGTCLHSFTVQMESARRLSLTVEFSAPLRCVWQRVSLAREIFFMQGMKNGTECTLSRENETLPGAKPDSERNRYDPCTTERRRRPRRPPKRAGREKGGAKNTDLPFRRSAWYIYMVVQDSRTRRARPLQLCPTQCNSPGSRRGGRHPSSFAAYLLMGLPTMADFRPGGLRRFGASLRSQYRSCGVWLPLSFYADAWPVVGCTAAGDIGSTDCLFTCQRHYITGIGRCQPSSLPQCHVQDHHYGKARGKGQRPRAGIAARGQQLGGHHIEHSPGGKAKQPG